MENLTESEKKFFTALTSPSKIQDYLDTIAFNHEETGETCMSPRYVILSKKAHCFEGALLAATALWFHKRQPRIVSLKVLPSDYDHIITVYKENGYWGAISKTNHAVLGYRDPVYKTIRELVMSYFHEYFLSTTGEKTLRGYSRPINVKRFGTKWITSKESLIPIAENVFDTYHIPLLPKDIKLRKATQLEKIVSAVSNDNH